MKGFLILSNIFSLSAYAAAPLTPVRVDLIEALSPTDTTASLRFQKEFEQAVETSRNQLREKLAVCGYTLQTMTTFFDANDPLQAKEKGTQVAKAASWVIVGPRRSNHYILLAKGSSETPTVSLMASASEILDLGPRHISLSPGNREMAVAAVKESQLRTSERATFFSIVSEDCISCIDFAESYNASARASGLKDLGTVKVSGEEPDMAAIAAKVEPLQPAIILLPNFSKVSAHIMSALARKVPKSLFVGSDGWGDSKFGFLQNDSALQSVVGITVRGFPPVEKAISTFPLGKSLARSGSTVPSSGPGLGIMKSLDGISEILCEARPKTREAFALAFERTAKSRLSAPFGVSVYQLKNSAISYERRAMTR